MEEAGLKGFFMNSGFGFVGPANLPRAVIERLNADMVKGITTPESRERLGTLGGDVVANTPAEFTAFIRADYAKWVETEEKRHQTLMKDAGFLATQ